MKRKHNKISGSESSKGYSELHPDNFYRKRPPDFKKLALLYPSSFGKLYRTSSHQLDFEDDATLRVLTETLLREDFSVNVTLRGDRLCPPVPNRLDYLCYINDLFKIGAAFLAPVPHHIIDIGVGSACIYPILGVQNFGWRFTGVDIDSSSLSSCEDIVNSNRCLRSSVTIIKSKDSINFQNYIFDEVVSSIITSPISVLEPLPLSRLTLHLWNGPIRNAFMAMGDDFADILKLKTDVFVQKFNKEVVDESDISRKPLISATICNPPFYDDEEDIYSNGSTVCTGSALEMRTAHGEVAFVAAMIADSLIVRESVLWYTSMLGKKSSLAILTSILKAENIPRIFSTRLTHGRTMRWMLAWSFVEETESDSPLIQFSKPSKIDLKD